MRRVFKKGVIMKHKIMGIVTLCALSLPTNYTFGAGFRIFNKTPFVVTAMILLEGLVWEGLVGGDFAQRPLICQPMNPGETWSYDAGVVGFKWMEVQMCDKVMHFDLNIPGITGIRNWTLQLLDANGDVENMFVDIGPVGLDKALGKVKGYVLKSSRTPCPCKQK
jgi:hypothetical protein